MIIHNIGEINLVPHEVDVDGILNEIEKLKGANKQVTDTGETALNSGYSANLQPSTVHRPSWNGKLSAASQQVDCDDCGEFKCGR